jgi:hypothetical protein
VNYGVASASIWFKSETGIERIRVFQKTTASFQRWSAYNGANKPACTYLLPLRARPIVG